jgi:hypothetical protein
MKIEDVPVRKIKQVQRYREDLGDLNLWTIVHKFKL